MQNPDGAAAAALRDAAEERALLRQAALRLEMRATAASLISAPTSRLTKLGPEDDVEAYLKNFERTAWREEWPEDQRAHILAPFLTGPAQQASQDLPPEQASQYRVLKQAAEDQNHASSRPVGRIRRPEPRTSRLGLATGTLRPSLTRGMSPPSCSLT